MVLIEDNQKRTTFRFDFLNRYHTLLSSKVDGGKYAGVTFMLNNVDLKFDIRDVYYDDSEDNLINYANMIVYPYGKNVFKLIT